jgi:hypothetical protein
VSTPPSSRTSSAFGATSSSAQASNPIEVGDFFGVNSE